MEEKEDKEEGRKRQLPIVSLVTRSGDLVELLHDQEQGKTELLVGCGDRWERLPFLDDDTGERLVPYSACNNLLRHGVILFPSEPAEYGTEKLLLWEIQEYIHRYVEVSDRFERIASAYVLLSWVYDAFNEVPYLRLRGDYGSGKTRFLLVVGAICNKPIFASAASTVSPIFHLLDTFAGTLVIDEGDFRVSDEKADIVKILNNGNVRGIPVLRMEVSRSREFNPRAFRVFGPKIVATRGSFDDRALESRFLTEEMGGRKLRSNIPLNLPHVYHEEARELRNKLLRYRLRARGSARIDPSLADHTLEPRLNQIALPLLSVIRDEKVRSEIRDLLRSYQRDLVSDRGFAVEGAVLEAIQRLTKRDGVRNLPVKEITEVFATVDGQEGTPPPSPKWIGSVIRKLGLKTRKSGGIYVVPHEELAKLPHLFERYGIEDGTVADTSPT